MTSRHTAALNRSHAMRGRIVTLRRDNEDGTGYEAVIPAFVRKASAAALSESIAQQDRVVIISATDLEAAQWPGAEIESRVPRNGDQVLIGETWHRVLSADDVTGPSGLARVTLVVRG